MNEMSCVTDIMQIILRKKNGEAKQNVHSIYATPIPSCNCINKLIPLIISLVYMTNNTGTLVNLIILEINISSFVLCSFATLLFNISYINYIKNLKYIKINKKIYQINI